MGEVGADGCCVCNNNRGDKLKLDGHVSTVTWTSYVKNVGMVLSEELDRERRDPANMY